MTQDKIVTNIRAIIQKRGLKQKYIAEKLGVTSQTLSNIMHGNQGLKAEYIPIIAQALDVTTDELFKS